MKNFISIQEQQKHIKKMAALGFSFLRSSHFALQGLMLPLIDSLMLRSQRETPKNYPQHLKKAFPKIKLLIEKDAENIANGLYPLTVLKTENIFRHSLRYPLILKESLAAARRRDENDSKSFDRKAEEFLAEMPEYYARNFHFQSSGYLGETSADLYEHQVEILFSGAADAMRRMILEPLKAHFNNSDGQGLHFLEIGSGTGRLTRFVALAFPKAKITCVDLSPVYLQKAKQRLLSFPRVNFIQAAGEQLPFSENTFDAVYSCFLFHELPLNVRELVIKDSLRVLKKKGFWGLVDSLQSKDDPDFDWALDQFPKDFHEPFYKNYTENSMEKMLSTCGLDSVSTKVGFLSKVVSAVKGDSVG